MAITTVSADLCARTCLGVCVSRLASLLNASCTPPSEALSDYSPWGGGEEEDPSLWLFKPPCPSRPPSFSLPVLVAPRGGEAPPWFHLTHSVSGT